MSEEVDQSGANSLHLRASEIDASFRPGNGFLAQGPFWVYSPSTGKRRLGTDLSRVGPSLHFQDGTALGRGFTFSSHAVETSEDGKVIWFLGPTDDADALFVLMPATFEDLRAVVPSLWLADFEEAARVVRLLLASRRWRKFGQKAPTSLLYPYGVVVWNKSEYPLIGVYKIGPRALYKRVDGAWKAVDESKQPWAGAENGARWFPILKRGVDELDGRYDPRPCNRVEGILRRFVFPRMWFDLNEGIPNIRKGMPDRVARTRREHR
jgi:hypothetical protein